MDFCPVLLPKSTYICFVLFLKLDRRIMFVCHIVKAYLFLFLLSLFRLGKAVEDAVNGVFIASLKMGAFYGMWTWLLHSLFSTNVVYIPSGNI